MLLQGFKLKDSGITTKENFFESVRYERRNLLEFGRTQNSLLKLRFNKLSTGNKTFHYDHIDMCVKERTVYQLVQTNRIAAKKTKVVDKLDGQPFL